MIFPWQSEIWQSLATPRGRTPHAILVHGQQGIGKSELVREYAKSLLCQSPKTAGFPCGTCQACNWFEQGSHPDFVQVQPDSMSDDEGGEAADDPEGRKGKRKPSKNIRIEQIRQMQETLETGSHQSGFRVIVIQPAEAMQTATANAVLKSLEEPPPDTVFILVSNEASRLLPTIRSRCRQIAVPIPPRAAALAWLAGEGITDAEAALAYAGGAPLAALALSQAGTLRAEFVKRLAAPGADPIALTDFCQTIDPPIVVNWLQQWVYDVARAASTGEVRYHGAQRERIVAISRKLDASRIHRFGRELSEARALSRHPLNARLFYESLFLSYRSLGGRADE